MNRLRSEFHRLYLPGADAGAADRGPALVDARGEVRALVLEVSRPASWEVLGPVWHGVQAELELPAPGIAVSGTDGLQLWFSLADPIAAQAGHAFLESLRAHFLADLPPRRLRLLPSPGGETHARGVPARVEATGNWSAFVAADLAPVFADTPWLDIPPGDEGQAGLLRGLECIKASAFDAARERLRAPSAATPEPALPDSGAATAAPASDPRRFLLRVMNDETVGLRLRIEAAKALLG